ncbi:flagellar assembly protein FliW [Sporolactobacillus putidus]|uniref:Flagellar assembly factor FliW n=1 Tax=Sporolactobacillus putidus TaxID=492735 RepID=A0A917S4T3_9BACL|nr:flagellar assembly protein FliW [Sporolactobacillus putidus]GGL54552.1 flagellar assembly factor FliW [Sporolactobacillus putidus]
MKILTKYFGEQEIDETEIVTFPAGLPGFADERRFIFQPFGEVFSILQSTDHAEVAFITTSPFLFFKEYSVDLPDHFVRQLAVQSEKDVAVQVIVSVQPRFSESTANLKAPVIINTRERIGKQYIPEQSSYSVRERLTPETETPQKRA